MQTPSRSGPLPTYWGLIFPVLRDAWKGWDFWAASLATVAFAGIMGLAPFSDRAKIARDMLTLGAPVAIALLAVLVAGFTLFSMLASQRFKEEMSQSMPYVTGAFLFSITIASGALMLDVLLFATSYVELFVQSPWFFAVGQAAFFGFAYTIAVVMQSAYELTVIILGQ